MKKKWKETSPLAHDQWQQGSPGGFWVGLDLLWHVWLSWDLGNLVEPELVDPLLTLHHSRLNGSSVWSEWVLWFKSTLLTLTVGGFNVVADHCGPREVAHASFWIANSACVGCSYAHLGLSKELSSSSFLASVLSLLPHFLPLSPPQKQQRKLPPPLEFGLCCFSPASWWIALLRGIKEYKNKKMKVIK